MTKIFQVRYTVSDKTVANEHYTEKGAKNDAKALSKAIGNAMIGEIDVAEDGSQSLVRVWEYTGGEAGKPIKKEGAPSSTVEILKTADETRTVQVEVEKKPKAPKKTMEEKIAAKKTEFEEGLAAINAGTFVIKAPGKKTASGEPKKPKIEKDKISKILENLGCSEKAAGILIQIGTTAVSRRAKVAAWIIDSNGPIAASEIITKLNNEPKETVEGEEAEAEDEREVDFKKVMSTVNFINYLFSKHEQPWRVTIKSKEGDTNFNFVPVKIEYQGTTDEKVEQSAVA